MGFVNNNYNRYKKEKEKKPGGIQRTEMERLGNFTMFSARK